VDNVVHSFKDLMLTEKTAQDKSSITYAPHSVSRPTTTAHQGTASANSESSRLR